MIKINEKYRVKGDKVIWTMYLLLLCISLIEVFSSMGKTVYEKQGGAITPMFFKHFFLLLSGIGICYISHLINYVKYSRIAKPALYLSIGLLVFTLVIGYLSPVHKAASRWIVIPFIGQFQPSEIAKYILIIYTSTFLASNVDKIKEKQTFINIIVPILLVCGLIFPENFSTAALIGLVCYILLLVGGINRRYYFLTLLGILVSVVLLVGIGNKTGLMRSNTWVNRIEEFRNPDEMAITQSNIARMAIATGGITGKFIGNTEQARFLSESHNDFIFAIMLEEGGLWMCLIIISIYIILLFRMIRIVTNAKGDFGAYLALGITLVFTLQAVVNMMVATCLIPVTGQTLPFVSYGGTSLWFSSFALGIVLNISRKENQITKNKKQDKEEEDSLAEEEVLQDELKENTPLEETTKEQREEFIEEKQNISTLRLQKFLPNLEMKLPFNVAFLPLQVLAVKKPPFFIKKTRFFHQKNPLFLILTLRVAEGGFDIAKFKEVLAQFIYKFLQRKRTLTPLALSIIKSNTTNIDLRGKETII